MNRRPNFLFFCTDQLGGDYLSAYGHPVLRTPHIDGLAARGTRFDNFYVATPVCMPNRAALMTGRMPSLNGTRHNGIPLAARSNTFVHLLRDAGYRTALLGKSHHQTYGGEALLRRAEPRDGYHEPSPALRDSILDPESLTYGLGEEDKRHWQNREEFVTLPYYGFNHVRMCTRHGDGVGGHYAHWLARRHPDPGSLIGAANALPHDSRCPQAWRTAVPEELYPTTYVAEMTEEFLRGHAAEGGDEPFFAFASFPDPHHPFTPPGRYWDMYDPDDVVLPASFGATDAETSPLVAWCLAQRRAGLAKTDGPGVFAVDEQEAREAIALTCGMIAMIDNAIGRVLAVLAETGLDRETVVIFTSDHGDFLGDHRLLLKGPIHYRSLIRVPFIWAEPDGVASVDTRLGSTVAIARTILERARVEPYDGMQGRNLLAPGDGPDSILIEEDQQRQYFGAAVPIRCRTVVTHRHRATLYHDMDHAELFDFQEDPAELRNLWNDESSKGLKSDMIERLARLQMGAADRRPLPVSRG